MAKSIIVSETEDPSVTLAAITTLLKQDHTTLPTDYRASFNTKPNSKLNQIQLTVDDHGQYPP